MQSLTGYLSEIVCQAFADQGFEAAHGRVTRADRPDLAQFQCNGAMAAAKKVGQNPRELAQTIADALQGREELAKVEIAGPGFINIDLSDTFLNEHTTALATDARGGVPEISNETVVLDYGGPNVAKPMHAGHLRPAIIGDALRRIMRFAGFETLGDVHLGDWGTHIGMIVSEYMNQGREDEVLNLDLDDPAQVKAFLDDLGVIYPQASTECKQDDKRMKQAHRATVKMQNRESPYIDMWRVIRDASVQGIRQDYANLGVYFDLWKGEADVHDYIAPMVEDLQEQHLVDESEGASVVHVERADDQKEIPPLILYKSDGAVMYGTTDLATIVERVQLYNPDRIVYVVDQRQHLHFTQVFRAAYRAGIAPESCELTHAGFGTMNGTDGKPFKTRSGGIMRIADMIEMAQERARNRLNDARLAQDMDVQEYNDIANKVGIAAIKFADLQNQRTSDYILDLDKMMSFEGKTGPYLMYQVVRIKSLLARAADKGAVPGDTIQLTETDRQLALLLAELPDVLETVCRHYMPHMLCDYAYRLAQTFASFYGACHILSEDDKKLQASRLLLCRLTHDQLERLLNMLGIEVPARM
jgi:arginyl-tRNA synthetase